MLSSRAWTSIGALCGVNFVAFVVIALMIGGDAVNGHTMGGHHYLSNHGRLTEVGEGVFEYSRLHAYSLLLTHPIAAFAFWKARKVA